MCDENEYSRDREDRDRHRRRERSKRRRTDRDRSDTDSYDSRSDDHYDDYDDDYDDRRSNRSSKDDYRDRKRDRDRDHDRRRRRDHDKETPYHTIIIKYLPIDLTEKEVRNVVLKYNINPKDIRVVKNRREGSGSCRGFAFVEFETVVDATQWMEVTQGVVDFDGGYRCVLFYSIPKDSAGDHRSHMPIKSDWNCPNCGAHNFKRRDVCFKCSAEKQDSVLYGEGYEEMSTVPTSTLLFRNLDTLSTEDSVLTVVSNCATLPIKKIKIAKDSLTGISRGFCYVEMHSVNEAMQLYNLLSVPGRPLIIDNREVSISYAFTSATYMPREASANIASAALAAAQWSNQSSETKRGPDLHQYNHNQQHYNQQPYNSQQRYSDYYQQESSSSAQSVNTAAAVAQNALQKMQIAKEVLKKHVQVQKKLVAQMHQKEPGTEATLAQQAQQWIRQQQEPESTSQAPIISQCLVTGEDTSIQYLTPDMSAYVYDESCGYYYDRTTGLYYDANTQYFYNADKQIYLYWDGERSTYVAITNDNSNAGLANDVQANTSDVDKKNNKGKDKQDKVKIAKKIAKDMERWAKTLNQKKDGSKGGNSSGSNTSANNNQSASNDVGFAMFEKRTAMIDGQSSEATAKDLQDSGLVAEYGGESESDDEDTKNLLDKLKNEENTLLDWNKMACLLCKRQFANKQMLQKHQQLSDLHKQNLESLKKQKFSEKELAEIEGHERDSKYRDRAKERRMKYGEPEPPIANNKLKDRYLKHLDKNMHAGGTGASNYEEPTKEGIGSENLGNKMLKAMGWNEGQGLGRSNQGMTGIIEAKKRSASAGLGMKGGTFGATAGDSYRDTVKKMMQTRYKDIDS